MENKKVIRTEEEKKVLNTRINKIIGQMNGIKKMIAEERYCVDIIIQLSAIYRSIKSLSDLMLESHMKSCLVHDIQNGEINSIEEILKLFKEFR